MPQTAQGRTIVESMRRSMLRKAKRPASSRDAAPASRLSYYASLLPGKESQFQTPGEGYRIYKDVPICRTGSQQYIGREIKKNPGYKAEWGIGDDDLVTVYRPVEEVTAPETIASFEGKSVLDEHPPDPKILIDALDEYDGVSKGHAQNIRIGQVLDSGEFAGETPLLADLHVKHPDLNVKVDEGIRDVSCGYTFRLDKDSSGRYIMREIRGNHIAVVPKGRAGSDVGIKDSAPKSNIGRITMSNRLLVALGLQAALKDAEPEEAKKIVDAAFGEEKEDKEEKKGEKDCVKDRKRGAKDGKPAVAALREAASGFMSALDAFLGEEEEEPEHGAKDKKKAAKDADEFGEDGMSDSEDESKEKEDEEREKQSKKAEKDAEGAIVLPPDEHAESNFSTGDAASLVSMLRPLVARSGDKAAKDAFSAFSRKVKAAQSGAKDAAADPFVALANISQDGAAGDSEPEIPMYTFFNGKSHAEGVKAFNEYQAARAAKRS